MRKFSYIVLFLICFSLATPSYAHLAAGEDKEIAGYIVDFGYEPEQIEAGRASVMLFGIANASTEEAVETTGVWVRISSADKVLFAGTIDAGETASMSYVFPASGTYEITARFDKADGQILQTSFNVNVGGNDWLPYAATLIAFLAGIVVCRYFLMKRPSRKA